MIDPLVRYLSWKKAAPEANAYSLLIFPTFFIANYLFFLSAFFLRPYSERNFI